MKAKKTKSEKPQSNVDKNTKAIVYFILVLFVVFILIIAIKYIPVAKAKQQVRDYHGFSFENVAGLWFTQAQKNTTIYQISLHFAPWEINDTYKKGNMSLFLNLMHSYNLTGVYVTINPEFNDNSFVALAYAELKMNLEKGMGIKPILACTKNTTDDCHSRPIIDPDTECPKKESMIIVLDSYNSTASPLLRPGVDEKTNCYRIIGTSNSLTDMGVVKAADRFIYMMYGIMQ